MNRDSIVLAKLEEGKPVTCYDFPSGVHFKDAILHLRNKGHDIRMIMIDDPKGIKRQIGQYTYLGKKDKVEASVEDYQMQIAERVMKARDSLLDNFGVIDHEFKGYSMLLNCVKANKATLDFINKEITSYNLRLEQTPLSS